MWWKIYPNFQKISTFSSHEVTRFYLHNIPSYWVFCFVAFNESCSCSKILIVYFHVLEHRKTFESFPRGVVSPLLPQQPIMLVCTGFSVVFVWPLHDHTGTKCPLTNVITVIYISIRSQLVTSLRLHSVEQSTLYLLISFFFTWVTFWVQQGQTYTMITQFPVPKDP